jgi:hypothetical protein
MDAKRKAAANLVPALCDPGRNELIPLRPMLALLPATADEVIE